MDDWSKSVTAWFDTVGEQAETWLRDRTQEMETTVQAIAAVTEQTGKDVADHLDRELTPWLEQLVQPLLDTPLDLDQDFDQAIDDLIQPWRRTIEPPLNHHPICSGCQHYHGQAYGGEMLVCGMYPYGPRSDQTSCADKQAIDWQEPWKTWLQQTWPPQNGGPPA